MSALTTLRTKILQDQTGFQPAGKPVAINVQENLLSVLDLLEGILGEVGEQQGSGQVASDTIRLSGGEVVWTENLDFIVSRTEYRMIGVPLTADETPVTLEEGDPTYPRIDVIAVDINGNVVVIPGTPDANPVKPYVDAESQLELTFINVAAGATTPGDGYILSLFDEDVEPDWETTESASSIISNSTASPRTGTKSIEFSNPVAGANIKLDDPLMSGADAYGPGSKLVFYIKSKAAWNNSNNGKRIAITIFDDQGQTVGAPVILRGTGTYGFDSSLTSDYQQVAIPMTDFVSTATYNSPVYFYRLKFTVLGTAGSLGCYIDTISLNLFQGYYSQSGRFGVEGEDDIATQDRIFNLNQKTLILNGLALNESPTHLVGISDTQELVRMSVPGLENPFSVIRYEHAIPVVSGVDAVFFKHGGPIRVAYNSGLEYNVAGTNFTLTKVQFSYGGIRLRNGATGTFNVTVPIANDIKNELQAGAIQGYFDYVVDNSSAAATINLVMNTDVFAASALTGGTNLAVTAGTSAVFRFIFMDSGVGGGNKIQCSRIA